MKKRIRDNLGISRTAAAWMLLLVLTLGMIGCSRRATGIQIVPLSSSSVLVLSADSLVEVMRRAGFNDEQIIQYGPDVYDGLSQSGALQVRVNDRVEAVIAINRDHGDCVYIASASRGNSIYNVQSGWLGGTGPR